MNEIATGPSKRNIALYTRDTGPDPSPKHRAGCESLHDLVDVRVNSTKLLESSVARFDKSDRML